MFTDFSAIPIFIAVVELGSFSRAAERLNITKSAVSKRITQLEQGLGARLLNRTTRQISLTEAGERYYSHVSTALNWAQQGVEAVAELQGEPSGHLRMSVPMSFGVRHIAPYIAEFVQRYPNVHIDIQFDDQFVDIVAQGLDMAIRIGNMESSTLVAKRLTRCRTVLCASHDYLQQHGKPQHPAQLRDHNCLQYSYFRGGQSWMFVRGNEQESVIPNGNIHVNNSEAIRRMLLSGLGIAQLPTFIAGDYIRANTLTTVMPDYQLPEAAVYAVYPERKYLPQKVRLFIDYLSEKFDPSQPYWDDAVFSSPHSPE
ncbi:LysR substrate-binding domain-containing protein [Vibrio zhugei]|uniref:LysR substrate-binding domain-containing protein n=1 Tax=Vibrio zhugei TaxID=2479546 RepID=A0ABV7CB25_9VIBR|nr:LysR family transcriptional regulator [Vibrio zhugei]